MELDETGEKACPLPTLNCSVGLFAHLAPTLILATRLQMRAEQGWVGASDVTACEFGRG